MMVFTASAVLFPLMALFIWLDAERYKVYLPLLVVGKCVGLFILVGWSIVSRHITIIWNSIWNTDGIANFIRLILCGDLFALAIILFIIRHIKKRDMMEDK